MENDQNNIDLFYRETLSGHKEVLAGNTWGRMKWRLFWINFRNYLIGCTALILLGTVSYFGFFANNQATDKYTAETISNKDALIGIETKPLQAQNSARIAALKADAVIDINQNPISKAQPEITNIQPTISLNSRANLSYGKAPVETKDLIIETSQNIQLNMINFLETKKLLPQYLINSNSTPIDELKTDSMTSPYYDIRKKVRFAISFYAAPAYTASSLSANNTYGDYLAYRNSHESGAITWSAGANFQVNIKNWSIQTGLNYAEYSDSRNYNHSFHALDSVNSYFYNDTTWGWVYDPPDFGKPIVLSVDSSFVPVYNDINEGFNTWKYIEIPLLVGYSFHANRFSFDISTGFSYGFFLAASGNVPDLAEENLFTELYDIEDQMNKNQFNYILQLGFAYHITPQWSLIMKPYYKQNLQSVFDKNYPIDQRFKTIGIQLGLKVDL